MSGENSSRVPTAIILSAIGVLILLLSMNVIPRGAFRINTPVWVLFIVGLIVLLAGLALFAGDTSQTRLFCVATAVSLMAVAFTWVAIWGRSEAFKGGIPLVPQRINLGLARLAFLGGALGFWLIAVFIWRDFLVKRDGNGSRARHHR